MQVNASHQRNPSAPHGPHTPVTCNLPNDEGFVREISEGEAEDLEAHRERLNFGRIESSSESENA